MKINYLENNPREIQLEEDLPPYMTETVADEIADIFYEQFKKHGVRLPETYTEQELIDLNPGVPVWFTKQHMKLKNKNES